MTEPQLVDLIDFCFKKLYGQSVTEQIIRNWIREWEANSLDLTDQKPTMPYQDKKNRFYGIWDKGYTGTKFKTKKNAERFVAPYGGHVKRFGYDSEGNMVQMKRPQVIWEKMEQ